MRFIIPACLVTLLILLTNCTIYRSPDRKDFESESSQFRTQNLTKVGCSSQSLRTEATASRLVTVLPNSNDSEFLWEHRIQNKSIFESDNLKGAYCVYEIN